MSTSLNVVDSKRLIACIFKKPSIWDKRLKIYKDRALKEKCWTEISKQLKVEEYAARKKWKYLRDQFVAELAKVPPENENVSKWQFFDSLLFLKDVVKPRQAQQENPLKIKSEIFLEDYPLDATRMSEDYDDTSTRRTEESVSEDSASDAQYYQRKKKKYDVDNGGEKSDDDQFAVQQKELEEYVAEMKRQEAEEDDCDLLFFKSLLSHVRRIPSHRKLSFRCKVQELVQQYAYP